MTWPESKAKAAEILADLRAQYPAPVVRRILRALMRQHHAEAAARHEKTNEIKKD